MVMKGESVIEYCLFSLMLILVVIFLMRFRHIDVYKLVIGLVTVGKNVSQGCVCVLVES